MDIPAAVRGSPVPLCMHANSPVRQRGGRPSPRKAARTITLRSCGEAQVLPVEQIVYAEVFDHELHIHTADGSTYCGRGHLSALEQRLSSCDFLRCHRSYLVHLPYVAGLRRYRITLSRGAALPVSKQNYLLIQRALAAYRLRAGRPHP